jgi:translation initiation factor 2B subunit (eIF-2B alpha/beta/delta family)
VEQRRLRELEEMAQRYEGERLHEAERTRGKMEELLRVVEERSRELEDMREAERRARQRVDELIMEVRAKEEEIGKVKNEWAARM